MTILVLQLITMYLAVGLAFGVVLVTIGAGRIDAAAKRSSIAFRALLLPGAAALWPVLLVRWVRSGRDVETR